MSYEQPLGFLRCGIWHKKQSDRRGPKNDKILKSSVQRWVNPDLLSTAEPQKLLTGSCTDISFSLRKPEKAQEVSYCSPVHAFAKSKRSLQPQGMSINGTKHLG